MGPRFYGAARGQPQGVDAGHRSPDISHPIQGRRAAKLAVSLHMMPVAEPHDAQRIGVVDVMGLGGLSAADFAGLAIKLAFCNCLMDSAMRTGLLFGSHRLSAVSLYFLYCMMLSQTVDNQPLPECHNVTLHVPQGVQESDT